MLPEEQQEGNGGALLPEEAQEGNGGAVLPEEVEQQEGNGDLAAVEEQPQEGNGGALLPEEVEQQEGNGGALLPEVVVQEGNEVLAAVAQDEQVLVAANNRAAEEQVLVAANNLAAEEQVLVAANRGVLYHPPIPMDQAVKRALEAKEHPTGFLTVGFALCVLALWLHFFFNFGDFVLLSAVASAILAAVVYLIPEMNTGGTAGARAKVAEWYERSSNSFAAVGRFVLVLLDFAHGQWLKLYQKSVTLAVSLILVLVSILVYWLSRYSMLARFLANLGVAVSIMIVTGVSVCFGEVSPIEAFAFIVAAETTLLCLGYTAIFEVVVAVAMAAIAGNFYLWQQYTARVQVLLEVLTVLQQHAVQQRRQVGHSFDFYMDQQFIALWTNKIAELRAELQ